MKLVRPNLTHEEAAKQFVAEFAEDREHIYFLRELDKYVDYNYRAWLRYIERVRIKHQFIQYFCIHNNQIVGMVELRYNKDRLLVSNFGHIGYIVSPKRRGNGYAKCMLFLALQAISNIVRGPIIVTCDDDNIPSSKTIRACGGTLKAKFKEPGTGILKRQYIFWRKKT